MKFLLEDYQPTPLLAPWGARSGFYPGASEKSAREALKTIADSKLPRLERYRHAICSIKSLLKQHGFDEKASEKKKLELLNICRAKLSDDLLDWLDACYVLTVEGRKFPPLLGTGGNEGSGSYVSGFAQQVVRCIIQRQHDALLDSALHGLVAFDSASDQTPGQFSPYGLGGYNGTSGFEAGPQTNPWDYLLALEGTLLFAASVTRRDEISAPRVSFPFCVAPLAGSTFGYGLDEERPKQAKRQVMELWLPVWGTPCCLDELRALLSEGRVTVGRRTAETGLDFARAISSFGVDRGISNFQRFAFLMRNGQSFFAAPMERFQVHRNPAVDLIADLDQDGWLRRVQRYARDDKAPNTFRSAVAQLDTALFALTQRADREALEKVLRQIGRIEEVSANSVNTRHVIGPLPQLSGEWARRANDGSAEYSIALALAGLSLPGEENGRTVYLGMRPQLIPVTVNGRAWNPDSGLVCWGAGSLEGNLAAVLDRRRLEAARMNAEGEVLRSRTGARVSQVERFIKGGTDDQRIAELLKGLVCVDLSDVRVPDERESTTPLPAYTLLKPFFTSESALRALNWLPPDRNLRLLAEMARRLASGDVQAALQQAWQRLRALGVRLPGREPPCVAGVSGRRLLTSLTIPLTYAETGRLLRWLDLVPASESLDESVDESI
jgi:CRISPR-associated protein Csx17